MDGIVAMLAFCVGATGAETARRGVWAKTDDATSKVKTEAMIFSFSMVFS
jgi:hypothetical protein